MLTDLVAFIATAIAGAVILLTGWDRADGVASLFVAAVMLRAAWGLLRDSGRIFLEAAPRGIDVRAVGAAMVAVPGITEVHDLHVWEVTSGFPALSAHVLVGDRRRLPPGAQGPGVGASRPLRDRAHHAAGRPRRWGSSEHRGAARGIGAACAPSSPSSLFALLAAPAAAQTPVDTTPTIAADGLGTATLTPDVADFAAGVAADRADLHAAPATPPTAAWRPCCGRVEGRRASPTPTSAPSGSRSSASGSKKRVRYRAEQTIVVHVRAVATLAPLIDAVADAGADQSATRTSASPTRPPGRTLATRAALADARRRADDAAAVAGLRITGVRTVSLDPDSSDDGFDGESGLRRRRRQRATPRRRADAASSAGHPGLLRARAASSTPPRPPALDSSGAGRTAGRWRPAGRPTSGRSQPPRGRLRSRPPQTSDVEPPPSRFIADVQPSATISSASSSSVRPGVVARAAVAGDREQLAVGEAERGARVAAVGDVGVELGLAGAEALGVVLAAEDGAPSRTSSGPACSRSPRGCGGRARRAARSRATPPRTCTQARTSPQGASNGT